MSTAGSLLPGGDGSRHFIAFDSETGKPRMANNSHR
jgi:hypothetical protein